MTSLQTCPNCGISTVTPCKLRTIAENCQFYLKHQRHQAELGMQEGSASSEELYKKITGRDAGIDSANDHFRKAAEERRQIAATEVHTAVSKGLTEGDLSKINPLHRQSIEKPSPREQLLREAIKITTSDRNKSYGNPEDNFLNIAQLWIAYWNAKGLSVPFEPGDVANMMILMKVARLATNMTHKDSALDVAGYAACLADIQAALIARSV